MIKTNVSYKRINRSSSVTLSRLVDHGLRLDFSSVKRWSRLATQVLLAQPFLMAEVFSWVLHLGLCC